MNEPVFVTYDDLVDVLYIVQGSPRLVEGDGVDLGVELDYSFDDGEPCGATVIGLKRYGWTDRISDLVKIIGNHLSVDGNRLKDEINSVVAVSRGQ